jgi:hypothetical protein
MKKTMIHLALTIVLTAAFTTLSFAQNIVNATLQWTASQAMNIQTGELLESPGSITTTGKSALEWKKDDGSTRFSFLVNEVVGSWASVAQTGTITYEIAGNSGNGTVTFQKSTEGITIKLFLTKEGEEQLFELSNISLQVL